MTNVSDDKSNGYVYSAWFGVNGHGLLVVEMAFKVGSSVERLVEYGLDKYDKTQARRVGTSEGCDYVLRILQAFSVCGIEDTIGRRVGLIREPDGLIVGFRVDGGGSLDAAEFWRNAKAG